MTNCTAQDATSALNLLFEVALRRNEELAAYSTHPDQSSSDDKQNSPCPYFDQFYEQGWNETIRDMTNLELLELEFLWQLLEAFIKQNYNVGRGKKSYVSGKYVLFTLLTVLNHSGNWEVLG